MRVKLAFTALVSLLTLFAATGCSRCLVCPTGLAPAPGEPLARAGDEIMAAGQLFHTGTRVVLWFEPGGYNAYSAQPVFSQPTRGNAEEAPREQQRYGQRRGLSNEVAASVATHGWTLDNLQKHVDQFVIHYDVCGTSRRCFYVLQDMRTLSVQFMLDLDGTVYQTLDLKERAWHAGSANDRSIGIEIAHMGAYPRPEDMNRFYQEDALGPYFIAIGAQSGILTPNFIARPSGGRLVTGKIHGRTLHQYDFTDAQYAALIKLSAALHRVLPKMALDVPRNDDGTVRADALSGEELNNWSGLIGHWHVTNGKIDPGPAFDWDRVIGGARRELGMSPYTARVIAPPGSSQPSS